MGANTIINLQKIYSLEKKPHLSKIHSDVIDFVEEQHPELFKQAVDDVGNYNPANPTIVDSYISVVHLMMLEKIPNFIPDEMTQASDCIKGVFKKFGIENTKNNSTRRPYDLKDEVYDKLSGIVENHCGTLAEISLIPERQ